MARSAQIKAIMDDIEKFTEKLIQRITLSVNGELIKTTPVDTGWARANWIPEIGHAYSGTAGSRESAESGSVDSAPQQAGTAKIATTYKLDFGKIFITNNVPYIVDLNDGSSAQAPTGFVQLSVARGIGKVKGIRLA